jgi:hypothetical protein
LNNCRQHQDLIKAGTGIQPYSLLNTMEATEEQWTFSIHNVSPTQVRSQPKHTPQPLQDAATFPKPIDLLAVQSDVR